MLPHLIAVKALMNRRLVGYPDSLLFENEKYPVDC